MSVTNHIESMSAGAVAAACVVSAFGLLGVGVATADAIQHIDKTPTAVNTFAGITVSLVAAVGSFYLLNCSQKAYDFAAHRYGRKSHRGSYGDGYVTWREDDKVYKPTSFSMGAMIGLTGTIALANHFEVANTLEKVLNEYMVYKPSVEQQAPKHLSASHQQKLEKLALEHHLTIG